MWVRNDWTRDPHCACLKWPEGRAGGATTLQGWIVAIIAVAYVSALFAIASIGDKRAAAGKTHARPYIYAFSLAIYCTSWTFFGSVGLATERTFEFLAIYIGPVLVFLFGYKLLKRIVTLTKTERITSIADFLSARYGKSPGVAALATLIATMGTIPYIALQLKAISGSVSLMVEHYNGQPPSIDFFISDISLIVAMLLALFAVLFGTRHADATEHQDGLVLAVAVESIVKLAAFLAVGVVVCFFLYDDPVSLFRSVADDPAVQQAYSYQTSLPTWLVMTALSGFAIIMLPRQFYVMAVEYRDESELKTASWVFPTYLVLINLFVLPIALAGLVLVGDQTSSDLYVLSLPLLASHDMIALLVFIGGLSAATAMVIVASVALSIMISNDLVIPLFIRRQLRTRQRDGEDVSQVILNIRRAAIFLILFAAFLYYRETTTNTRLASIGLISFAAVAQFAPALIGGLIWRGANSRGALLGMGAGLAMWAYTLLFPSLAPPDTPILATGLFGIEALRPQSLFGTIGEPLNHGVLWSLSINMLFFVLGSLSRAALPLERIQAAIFVPRETSPLPNMRRFRTAVTVDDLRDTIGRYLGVERTERSFESFQLAHGLRLAGHEQATMPIIRFSEQLLTSAVGSSSSRLILSLLFQRNDTNPRGALRLLDDATEALQQNRDLLQTALDQMAEGITVFDRDLGLTCWNRQFRRLFDLPDEMGQVGVSLYRIMDFLVERGDLPPGSDKEMLNRMTWFGQVWAVELLRSRRMVEIRTNPMPDGGLVATYTDITDRVEADLALKRVNETLEQRVKSRTAELTRVNEELAQAQRLAEEANLGKTRFLAAAGHDILQPLNAARLYCSSLGERAGRGRLKDNDRQHRIVARFGGIDPGGGARHIPARHGGHEAGGQRVPPRRAVAADRNRLPADGGRKEAAPVDHPEFRRRQHGPQPAAPVGAEPRLQRHQVYAQRPRHRGCAAARRSGRDPGRGYRHRDRGRQAQHGVSRIHTPGRRRARGAGAGAWPVDRGSHRARAAAGNPPLLAQGQGHHVFRAAAGRGPGSRGTGGGGKAGGAAQRDAQRRQRSVHRQ